MVVISQQAERFLEQHPDPRLLVRLSLSPALLPGGQPTARATKSASRVFEAETFVTDRAAHDSDRRVRSNAT